MRAVYILGIVSAQLCLAQTDGKSASEVLAIVMTDVRESQWPDLVPAPRDQTSTDRTLSILATLAVPLPPPLSEGGIISVASLRHKIPPKAEKAFRRAEELTRSRKYADAARELEKAVAIDSDFAQAHANLGAQYLRLRRYAEAEASFRRSLELDSSIAATHANLALLRLTLGNLRAAEGSARRALQLSSTNAGAHYSLGLALLPSPEARAEAIQHLEYAARTIPAAKRTLEELQNQ